MNVLIIGSLGFDYIMHFSGSFTDRIKEDKIHSLSLSFLVDTLSKQHGGTAGNIAYTAKLLGLEPFIFACAGNDFAPYKRFFVQKKISTKYIYVYDDLSTSSYFVVTDRSNNQIGSFYTGAMVHASKHSIKKIKEPLDFVIITATDPKAMKKSVKECQQLAVPYMYDPAFQIATFTKDELLSGIDHSAILIGNDYEISLIEDKIGITHEELITKVPLLITTLGGKGSILETRHEHIFVKAAKAKNDNDPTGAGDAYRAGFLAGYLRGFPLDVCGEMGSIAAVYTVELYGTQTHTFTKKSFSQRFEENYGKKLSI